MDQAKLHQICQHFQGKPVEYAEQILGLDLTNDQKHILVLLTEKPYKVLVRSANTCGKSFLAAVAALYLYDCFDPSICIISAPTFKQVAQIIFKEVRTLGVGRDGFAPKKPILYHHPKHMIVGNTANNATAFQGHHDATVSIIVDEMVGVDGEFIEASQPMLAGPGHFFLGLFNPTDQSSHAWLAEKSDQYHLVELNALKHPNILAELEGKPAPFPNAVRLERLRDMIEQWCEEVTDEPLATDFEFDAKWWRPSPVAEARLLGRWPSLAASSIWSETLFDACVALKIPDEGVVQVGCDVAAFGDDDTCIVVRRGKNILSLETHNGWSPIHTANRLKELSNQYRLNPNLPPAVVIDDTGLGVGVSCHGTGYNFHGINFASKSINKLMYRNKRDELHFNMVDQAKAGNVSFAKLSLDQQHALRKELLAPKYTLDPVGRRRVEAKEEIKKRLGKSNDLSDAVHLAWYPISTSNFKIEAPKPKPQRALNF